MYEIVFLISILYFILLGVIFSFMYTYEKNYANFYQLYLVFWMCLLCLGLFMHSFNIINWDYSLFFISYLMNPYIYLIKVVFLVLSILFWIALKYYSELIRIYTFEMFLLVGCSLLGMFFLLSAGDFVNMYLSVELYSLSIYCFMSHFKGKLVNIEAALKYFIIGSISSSLILFSMAGMYSIFGTFSFFDIEIFLYYELFGSYDYALKILLHLFIYLLIISLFIKIGAAPFHLWFIDIYDGTSYIVTFFLLVVSKFSFISFIYSLLTLVLYNMYYAWKILILIVIISSLFIGYIGALYQTKIKRILSYSSISNISLFLALCFVNVAYSLPTFIFVSFVYFINLTAFFYIILILYDVNSKRFVRKISHLRSIFYYNELIAGLLLVVIFSLAGLPPFMGFFGKFFVLLVLSGGYIFNFFLIVIILVGSVLSVVYYLRLIKVIFINNYIDYKFFHNNISYFLGLLLFIMVYTAGYFLFYLDDAWDIITHFTNEMTM